MIQRLIINIILLISFFSLILSSEYVFAKPSLCDNDNFTCHRVKRNESWRSLFPDPTNRGIVMRINHTNKPLYRGQWIAVPNNLDTSDILDFSPLPLTRESENEKIIVFDPARHAFGAYDEFGDLVRWGPATGGGNWCRDIERSCRTQAGTFRIYSLGSSNCISSKFPVPEGGAPMPYCMFFNGGIAFHGSPGGVSKNNVSHGCVRLFVQDAEWLRYNFAESPNYSNNFRGTKVVVLPYHAS